MTELKITVKSEVDKFAGNAAKAIPPSQLRASRKAGKLVMNNIRRVIKSSSTRSSGKLADSFFVSVSRGGSGITVMVGSDSPYALIQEEGGTIKRKSKWLTVPVTERARRVTARQFGPELFFVKVHGHRLLATREGKGLKPQYVLKDQVTLKAKRYLSRALGKSLVGLERMYGDSVVDIINNVSGR